MPRTLEGELKVDNEEYKRDMQDPESEEYLQFANNFATALKKALFDKTELENSNNEVTVEVVQLRYVAFYKIIIYLILHKILNICAPKLPLFYQKINRIYKHSTAYRLN